MLGPHIADLQVCAERAGSSVLLLAEETPDMRATIERGLEWLEEHHTPQPSHPHGCTCPGACCPGVSVRLTTPAAIAPARIIAFVEPVVATATIVRSADVQVALPPAIGPPTHSG